MAILSSSAWIEASTHEERQGPRAMTLVAKQCAGVFPSPSGCIMSVPRASSALVAWTLPHHATRWSGVPVQPVMRKSQHRARPGANNIRVVTGGVVIRRRPAQWGGPNEECEWTETNWAMRIDGSNGRI